MKTHTLSDISSLPGLHFIKDTELNYIAASNDLVNIAGSALIGKSDFDAHWEPFAELYRSGDKHVMKTNDYFQRIELFLTPPHDSHFIMVTKRPFFESGKVTGVIGNAQIISETVQRQLLQLNMHDKDKSHRQYDITHTFPLLTERESHVLFHLIRNKTAKEIAKIFSISHRTVEKQIEIIKHKFNVKSKDELVQFALKNKMDHMLLKSQMKA